METVDRAPWQPFLNVEPSSWFGHLMAAAQVKLCCKEIV